MPAGRPSTFNEEIADDICVSIMEGKPLREICAREGYPAQRTVFQWLEKNPAFAQNYARAREYQADFSADYLVEIGERVARGELASDAARVMVDVHKWTAARRAPKKYGDQINVNQNTTFKTVTDKPLTKEEETARWLSQFGNARTEEGE